VTAGTTASPHAMFMREALGLADEAARLGEVPVGALIVLDGMVVGRGHNCPISTHDPTAHAEIVALRDAGRRVGNYRLPGATLYVTIEPCGMCVGAMAHARVATLVYGATEPTGGAIESAGRTAPPQMTVVSGVLSSECRRRMQAFFAQVRG
jgi:tRNA(Arg) A34 adenosine deaminase TadA